MKLCTSGIIIISYLLLIQNFSNLYMYFILHICHSYLLNKVHKHSNIFETSKLVSLEVLPIIISNELLKPRFIIHSKQTASLKTIAKKQS